MEHLQSGGLSRHTAMVLAARYTQCGVVVAVQEDFAGLDIQSAAVKSRSEHAYGLRVLLDGFRESLFLRSEGIGMRISVKRRE